MAVKVTKSQISDGTISENTCIEECYLCGKFHGFMKKCTIFWLCRYTKYTPPGYETNKRHLSHPSFAPLGKMAADVQVPVTTAQETNEKLRKARYIQLRRTALCHL